MNMSQLRKVNDLDHDVNYILQFQQNSAHKKEKSQMPLV